MKKNDEERRMRRNLNPTPDAIFAIYHWHKEYAAQGGGVMDFWDLLPDRDKNYCTKAVVAILFPRRK